MADEVSTGRHGKDHEIPIARRLDGLRPTAVNRVLADVREFVQRGQKDGSPAGPPVSLMRGEPDFATPDHIVEAAVASLRRGRTMYANNQGDPDLRRAISEWMSQNGYGEYCADSEILVTSGATLGIYAALAASLDAGDEVLIPEPVYDAYHSVIALLGATAKPVPAVVEDGRFRWPVDAVASACGATSRAILINTPWNPTGAVFDREELSALVALAADRGLSIISDEIYHRLVFDGRRHVSPSVVNDEGRRRTAVIQSLSKTYAMTGWRLGFCAGPADWIRAMSLVLQQSSRGPTTFVQDAGVAALLGNQSCVSEMRDALQARRQRVLDAVDGLPGVRPMIPDSGFFVLLDARQLGRSSDAMRRILLWEHGIVVVHGAAYGDAAEGMLRISYASGGDTLDEGLARLRKGLLAIADTGPAGRPLTD